MFPSDLEHFWVGIIGGVQEYYWTEKSTQASNDMNTLVSYWCAQPNTHTVCWLVQNNITRRLEGCRILCNPQEDWICLIQPNNMILYLQPSAHLVTVSTTGCRPQKFVKDHRSGISLVRLKILLLPLWVQAREYKSCH